MYMWPWLQILPPEFYNSLIVKYSIWKKKIVIDSHRVSASIFIRKPIPDISLCAYTHTHTNTHKHMHTHTHTHMGCMCTYAYEYVHTINEDIQIYPCTCACADEHLHPCAHAHLVIGKLRKRSEAKVKPTSMYALLALSHYNSHTGSSRICILKFGNLEVKWLDVLQVHTKSIYGHRHNEDKLLAIASELAS